MNRLDQETEELWREKEDGEKLDLISDDEFFPAKEVEPTPEDEILIKVIL